MRRFVEFLASRGIKKVSEVTRAQVQSYQQHLLKDLKPLTVRHCMFGASGLMSFAVKRGYQQFNPVKNVAKVKAEKNPPRYLSFEEWARVREIAAETYLWPLVATAYYTGFRNSELRFLTWEEVDFERDVITITNKEGFSLKNRQSRTVLSFSSPFPPASAFFLPSRPPTPSTPMSIISTRDRRLPSPGTVLPPSHAATDAVETPRSFASAP